MKNFTCSLYLKCGLAASLVLFAFNTHAQVTNQAVVEAFPDLTDGTFVIGATGAYDVDTNEDVTLHAVNSNTSLTLQNGSNYTSNNHDILLASWYGSAATLNITGGIIDLGSGYIMADRDDDDGRASEAPAYVNITGGTVNLYGFRAYNHLWGGWEVAVEVPSTLHVNISGQGTSVSSNEPVSLSSSFEGTVNITVSDGAVYSMPNDDHVDSFSIESGGTLESRGNFSAANLNFASGGTLKFGGVGYYIDSISSGQTIVLDGGSFYDTTTLAGGTLKTAGFDMSNLTFSSGTLEATGSLTNLQSISSSQTVILDGGNWAPSGNINAGNTTIQNSGTLTVGDLDASNLTFTSGTLTTTGELTNLNSLGAGQIVQLDGGTLSIDTLFSLDANASITGNGSISGDVNLGIGGALDGDATGLDVTGDIGGSGLLTNVTVYGDVYIGNSPGEIELQGTTLANGSTVYMEILGIGEGEFDTLIGDALSDVSGAILNISFIGYTPMEGDSWQLISGGIDPSSFNSINTPENYALSGDGSFTAIPEPGTILMFACFGLAAVIGLRRRR